jgi:hypothetical protein
MCECEARRKRIKLRRDLYKQACEYQVVEAKRLDSYKDYNRLTRATGKAYGKWNRESKYLLNRRFKWLCSQNGISSKHEES